MTSANTLEGWIVKDSNHYASDTADKLVGIIDSAPPLLFAHIDYAAGARSIEIALKARYSIEGAEQAFEGMAGAIGKMTDGAAQS